MTLNTWMPAHRGSCSPRRTGATPHLPNGDQETMDRLQAMQIFTRVVEANSFNKAAEALSLSPSSVTGSIKNLEEFLGVRLLQRTTRRLNLTLEGTSYYESCRNILLQIAQTEAAFHMNCASPKGALRIHMPAAIGRVIVLPELKDFQSRFPDIDLTITLGDGAVDLVQEGLDLVIRAGEMESSSFVARRLGTFQWLLCAAPAYLAHHGEPRTVEDLAAHRAVGYTRIGASRMKDWDFVVDGKPMTTRINSGLQVNDADGYLTCGLQGLGLIRPPSYVAWPFLGSGRLREMLADCKGPPEPLSVVYAHGRLLSPAARACAEWLVRIFAASPLLGTLKQPGSAPCS
jgi:LysR family transcriptional regulator, regulator for bpeEF and oprC